MLLMHESDKVKSHKGADSGGLDELREPEEHGLQPDEPHEDGGQG